jgi:hypothetical protein
MYWQSFSLHPTKSLPRPPSVLRRRNVMDTGSETTGHWKGFDGMRVTRGSFASGVGGTGP